MDSTTTNNFTKSGASLVNKAEDKLQGGIRDTHEITSDAANTIADKAAKMGSTARNAMDSMTDQAKHGMDAVKDAAVHTRDSVSRSSESLLAYTRENPLKALLMAAASGALVWAVLKRATHSRN